MVAVVLAGPGCSAFGGSKRGSEPLSEAQLGQLVVLPADIEAALPGTALTQFDGGPLTANDAVPGPRADESRFERRTGWKARYRRADAGATRGVLVVESRVDEFTDSKGAGSDLAAYATELEEAARSHGGALLPVVATIGAKTVASSYDLQALSGRVRYYTVAWRHGRLTASVTISGFDGTSLDAAIALARRVQTRIEQEA